MTVSEFSAAPLFEPMRYQEIMQGEYATADLSPETTHIATFGLFVCKALSIYNPRTQSGLLAHIDATLNPEMIADHLIKAYDDDISEAEVTIAKSEEIDEPAGLWPTMDVFVDILKDYNPEAIYIDRNKQRRKLPRGFALSLESGRLHEAQTDDVFVLQSVNNHRRGKPIRDDLAIWF